MRRASGLPLLGLCPSSSSASETSFRPWIEGGELGQAVHAALAWFVEHPGEDVNAIVASTAEKFNVDPDDVGRLVRYGASAWQEIKKYLPSPKCEADLTDSYMGAHADVIHHDTETCVIVDWKSGFKQRNYRWQMGGYAWQAASKFGVPSSGQVTTIVVWLRHSEIDVKHWSADDLAGFRVEVEQAERKAGKEYSPGEHCGLCPRQLECQALSAYRRSAMLSLGEVTESTGPMDLAKLYPSYQMAKAAIEQYNTAVRAAVMAHGPQDVGTHTLGFQSSKEKIIDPLKGWEVLTGALTEEELAGCVSVSKPKVEKAVAAKAEKGNKGKAGHAVIAYLAAAGAITENEKLSLSYKPNKET